MTWLPWPIIELAHHQFGLVTRLQLLAVLSASAIDRRVRAGLLIPVAPGVYRLPGAPCTWRQRACAAQLAIGEPVALSHRPGPTCGRPRASPRRPSRSPCPTTGHRRQRRSGPTGPSSTSST